MFKLTKTQAVILTTVFILFSVLIAVIIFVVVRRVNLAEFSKAILAPLTMPAPAPTPAITETPKLTQNYIDQHIGKMLQLQSKQNLPQPNSFTELNSNQEVFILQGSKQITQTFDEKPIMLASVSKVAVNIALVRALERSGNLNIYASMDHKALIELFGRSPNRLVEQPIYVELVKKYPKISNIVKKGVNARDEFAQLIPESIQYEVPLNEILFQALNLSSNAANDIAKGLVSRYGTSLEAELKTIVPSYTPSPVDQTKLQHWLVPLPNVGPISEHVKLIHELGQKLKTNTLTTGENLIMSDLVNNPQDFEHDFTHSALGKSLIARGYRIVEKTGYYPVVYWVQDFADPPFEYPPHMQVSTIVSIVPPVGSAEEVVSLGYYQLYALRLPETTSNLEIDGVKLVVPDVLAPYVTSISNPIKSVVNPKFRKQIEDKVRGYYP